MRFPEGRRRCQVKYIVTITGKVTKRIEIEAKDEQEAGELASSEFSTEPDGSEKYSEEVDSIEELEGGAK